MRIFTNNLLCSLHSRLVLTNKKGWIVATRSSLLEGGKEVLFEKYYKTGFHAELYLRLWNRLSHGRIKEYENVKYTFFKDGDNIKIS